MRERTRRQGRGGHWEVVVSDGLACMCMSGYRIITLISIATGVNVYKTLGW